MNSNLHSCHIVKPFTSKIPFTIEWRHTSKRFHAPLYCVKWTSQPNQPYITYLYHYLFHVILTDITSCTTTKPFHCETIFVPIFHQQFHHFLVSNHGYLALTHRYLVIPFLLLFFHVFPPTFSTVDIHTNVYNDIVLSPIAIFLLFMYTQNDIDIYCLTLTSRHKH